MKLNSDTERAAHTPAESPITLDSAVPRAATTIGALLISGESVDRLGDALLLVGPNGTVLDANTTALQMYGYSHEELVAMRVHDLMSPRDGDDADRLSDWADDCAPCETRHVHRDGTPLPVAVRSLPVLVERGDAASLMVVRAADDASRAWDALLTTRRPLSHAEEARLPGAVDRRTVSRRGPKTVPAAATDAGKQGRVVNGPPEETTRVEAMAHAIVEAMGRAVETRDPYTRGHEKRVASFAKLVAAEMGLSENDIAGAEIAGAVHDVGKISVPAEILCKPGHLSQWEMEMIRQHPAVGYEILKDIAFPWPVAESVLQHHERMDGSGYPHGLTGDEICRTARILAVADAVEAMASDRPYRPALGIDAAISELLGNPRAYDQTVVEACLRLHESGRIVW